MSSWVRLFGLAVGEAPILDQGRVSLRVVGGSPLHRSKITAMRSRHTRRITVPLGGRSPGLTGHAQGRAELAKQCGDSHDRLLSDTWGEGSLHALQRS